MQTLHDMTYILKKNKYNKANGEYNFQTLLIEG